MDIFLSRKVQQSLSALNLLYHSSDEPIPDGMLIGHKRTHRFFLEKIFPSQKGFFPYEQTLHECNQIFKGKIMGFYSFHTTEEKVEKLLCPIACGKVFLQIDPKKESTMSFTSYIIDYKDKFFLNRISLTVEKQ
ncbi:MAG: hypothetical protein ACOC5F_03040 [Candidatus Aminicenantaceae bacterium]